VKQEPKHPRLTPVRAVQLLRVVANARGHGDSYEKNAALDRVAEELSEHITAELVSKRRRR